MKIQTTTILLLIHGSPYFSMQLSVRQKRFSEQAITTVQAYGLTDVPAVMNGEGDGTMISRTKLISFASTLKRRLMNSQSTEAT